MEKVGTSLPDVQSREMQNLEEENGNMHDVTCNKGTGTCMI